VVVSIFLVFTSDNKIPPKCLPLCKKKEFQVRSTCPVSNKTLRVSPSLKKPLQIVDMNGNDTFLDVNDAHLRVTSGNVYASAFNLDQIDIVMSSNTASTVNFNNPTKAFNAASNIEVGTANLFVDTTTSNVGIGTDTPLDTLHINGGTRFAGHIIPTTNATFDIGEPENKIRDIYVDTNSLWIGDLTKIAFERGKMKFKRRKINKVPTALVTLATSHVSELNTEAEVQTDAVTFAQTIDHTISTVEDLKLEHWRDYAKRFDETKAVSDIFIDNDEDYEAVTASEAFMEVDSNIFTEHSLSIGKTTDPTSALDVVGTVKATAFEGDGSALTGIVAGQWTESSGDIYRSSGNVGVGTDSPAKTLHVAGTMRIANATTNTETTDIVKIASTTTTTTTTTPFTGWSQEAEVYASNRSSYDYFGQGSAMSGDGSTFVSIARSEDTTASDSGAVYVYTYNGSGGWPQTTMLKASDAASGDILGESGISISHDGTRILVAARNNDDTYTNSGSAYVFDLVSGSWSQTQKLVASNPGDSDHFGRVKISGDGNTIFVGAHAENGPNDALNDSGALYYFTNVNGTWTEQQLIRPSVTNVSDIFGLVIGSSYDGASMVASSRGMNSNRGAAFIFELQNGTYVQTQMIQASNGEASDYFGTSIDMSSDGNTVAVGAHHESGPSNATADSGAVYVFEKSESGTWSETAILRANNLGAGDNLGGRVNISGNGLYIVAGARNEDTPHSNAGSVYVFRKDGTTWSQVAMLSNTDTSGGDLFGDSVCISSDGEVIAGGAVLDDVTYTDTGSAYIFRGTGAVTTTTTTTIPSSLKINDTIVATAFQGDGSALTGIVAGQWTESGGNISRSTGNVGIGTTNPVAGLDIRKIGEEDLLRNSLRLPTNGGLTFVRFGRLGSGTDEEFAISKNITRPSGFSQDDANYGSQSINFSSDGTLSFSTGVTGITTGMTISPTSNVAVDTDTLFVDSVNDRVGIGTTSPGAKMDIYTGSTGTVGLSFDRYASGNYRTDIYQNTYGLDFRVGYAANTPESVLYLKRFSDGNKEVELNGNVEISGYLKTGNPVFYARKTTGTAHNSYIIYNAVDVNIGSCYDSSTGIFTCPVAGAYTFTWGTIAGTTDTVYRLHIRVNGNTINNTHLRADNTATGSEYSTGERTAILNLAANDEIRIFFAADDSTSSLYGSNYTHFQGYLISRT